MLVLTRKNNEEIVIDDEIIVTVLEIRGNTVKLGLTAPRNVSIRRGELPVTPRETPAGVGPSGPPSYIIEAVMA